jgi:hypothetical protein
MGALHRLVLVCAVATAASACGPDVRINEQRFQQRKPKTLAILPFTYEASELGDRGELRVAAIQEAFRRRLAPLAYLDLRREEVRKAVERRVDRPDGSGTWKTKDLQDLGAALGVDALVVGHVADISNFEGGVLYRQVIEGELRLVDARTAEELVRVEHTQSETGGFLLGSSQSVEAVQQTVDNASDIGFVRLVERFVGRVAKAFPGPPEPASVIPPEIASVQIEQGGGGRELGAGDLVEVTCRADEGLYGHFDLGRERREIPMSEVRPGLYQASYRVQPGDDFSAIVSVHVGDRFGVTAIKHLRDQPVLVRAGIPPTPTGLEMAASPGDTVKLTWDAPDSDSVSWQYRVFGLDRRRVPRLIAVARPPKTEATVRGGYVAYGVAVLDGKGRLGRPLWAEAGR